MARATPIEPPPVVRVRLEVDTGPMVDPLERVNEALAELEAAWDAVPPLVQEHFDLEVRLTKRLGRG